MTLEQANHLALAAAARGDLVELRSALGIRAAAISALSGQPAVLAQRIKAAIEAGEIIARDLRLVKLQLRVDSSRAAQLQAGLTTGMGVNAAPSVTYRG